MAGVKFDSKFFRKMEAIVTPKMRKEMAKLSKMEAHWGIRNDGELAMIMGVLNFGDPAHTVPNRSKGTPQRKAVEDAIAAYGGNDSAIPPRPWLSNSVRGAYDVNIKRYVNENLPIVLRGMSKVGTKFKSKITPDQFIKGLAEVGRDNARKSWESGKFAPNAPMTLQNKSDPRPLHDTGRMNAGVIEAWTK